MRNAVIVLALLSCACRREASGKAAEKGQARVVPVIVARVARRDVPVVLDGLGTVQAHRSVSVRPQVDGRLLRVHFREGGEIRRGQLLAEIDARPFRIALQQAEGALARDHALFENARQRLERDRSLIDRGLVAQSQVDDTAAQVAQLEGAVRIDRATIEKARLDLDWARIASPVDGVAGVRLIDPGNLVRAADPNAVIVVIAQLDPISVLFTLPQDDLPRVSGQMRQGAPLLVEAYSRDGQNKLGTGELLLIDNQINTATATMRLKAVFPNPQRVLWPNQFVKARLLLATRADALVVPASAVLRGPDRTFVYVVDKERKAQPRDIEIEGHQGELALVAKGIEADELVIVEGQNQLRPGAPVSAREAGRPAARRGHVEAGR